MRLADILSAVQQVENLLGTQTGGLCSGLNDWPNGKSYPVTAAQLLPILTGFLAPTHFFKLAKNRDED